MIWTYIFIAVLLLAAELVYFKIADKYNIIDKPNERSSHSTIVLRGGGIIFTISILVWFAWQTVLTVQGVQEFKVMEYLPFIIGLVLICGVSFWDDVHSLPYSVRLVVQFIATGQMIFSLMMQDFGFMDLNWYWQLLICIVALVVLVGATDVYNFMDGINGITAGYSLSVLVPLLLLQGWPCPLRQCSSQLGIAPIPAAQGFIEQSYLVVAIIGVLVFSFFNFRPKGKAKCFAGDVGSVGIAFILLFAIARLILQTEDVTWVVLLLVYGVDGCCTIIHRLMLHENLGEAHRKHAYQLMCNELKIGHVKISVLYMCLQLTISLVFIYLCPSTLLAHWIYLVSVGLILVVAYVVFMKKYYHLHEAFLASQKHE